MYDHDLKTKYEYFLENLNLAYDLGIELCKNIKNSINPSEDENYNLQWKLYYLELYMEQLEKIIETTEKTIFFDTPQKPVVSKNNLVILPLFPDEDIFIEADTNIKDMFKQ